MHPDLRYDLALLRMAELRDEARDMRLASTARAAAGPEATAEPRSGRLTVLVGWLAGSRRRPAGSTRWAGGVDCQECGQADAA